MTIDLFECSKTQKEISKRIIMNTLFHVIKDGDRRFLKVHKGCKCTIMSFKDLVVQYRTNEICLEFIGSVLHSAKKIEWILILCWKTYEITSK